MAQKHLFVDESGDLTLTPAGTRYFILTSIALNRCTIGYDLLQLRRNLLHFGLDLPKGFHAPRIGKRFGMQCFGF